MSEETQGTELYEEEEVTPPELPQRRHDEKQEKQEEKEEKSWDEKWRRDPMNVAAWAVILIWAGIVLLASNLRLLNWIPFFEPWSIFFLGAGCILFLEVAVRLLIPAYRQPLRGTVIVAIVFVGIALVDVISWACVGPLVLIGIGVYVLVSGLLRHRE